MNPGITIRPGQHKGWEAWHLENGPLQLVLVPQMGGRITGAVWRHHDLFFTQPEREGQQALFDVARCPERAGELRQDL